MVPAQLDAFWVEFFSINPKLYWAESRFTLGLINSPYSVLSPKVIGSVMFGQDNLGANTGWTGSGFAQAGAFGVICYSMVIGLFFSYLQMAARRLGNPLVASMTFPIMFTILLSADLVTSLLTHGLVAMILCIGIIYRFPHQKFI